MTVVDVPRRLDMGVWWADGQMVWLPKFFFPTRNDAKRFAVAECYSQWIDVRVRTVWMVEVPHKLWDGEFSYHRGDKHTPGAIECWEIDT